MKRHLSAVILISAFLFSCVSYQPPGTYSDGFYTYPKYGLSVLIPEGWEVTGKTPSWTQPSKLALRRDRIMLIRADTKGFISIGLKKLKMSLMQAKLVEAKLNKKMTEILEKRKEDWNKDFHTFNYSYKIFPLGNCL